MVSLVARKRIEASVEKVFEAWTDPQKLKKWWGPKTVICEDAELDLKTGGLYRLANRFPDGTLIWIRGVFELVEPPHKLIYSWETEPTSAGVERVTVQFVAKGDATEVSVRHEKITNEILRDQHQQGWDDCLEGLGEYFLNL